MNMKLWSVEQEYPQVIEENVQVVQRIRNLVEWMPRGWIMECYVNQSTGYSFYSKEKALQFLQSGNVGSHSAYSKSRRVSDSNVIAQIEYSPDGAPPGRIREYTVKGLKAQAQLEQTRYLRQLFLGSNIRNVPSIPLHQNKNQEIKGKRCNLMHYNGSGEVVANGIISDTDAGATCHGEKLGLTFYRVQIVMVYDASLVLPFATSDHTTLQDTVGSFIKWPRLCVVRLCVVVL